MIALAALACATPAHAFKLQAFGSAGPAQLIGGASPQAQAFMRHFTVDIHERITRQAYEKAGVALPEDVLAGVRWNDNPPATRIVGALFGNCGGPQTSEGIACWASMMRLDRMAWETLTRREKALAPVRSHFGDMQFLHAMASHSGESAEETRRNILKWSEFAWRVARGEIEPRANVYKLRGANSTLDGDTADWVSDLFRGPSKKLWTVQDMLVAKPPSLRLKAFGTLLHVVEDAYSDAHVSRESKRVQANGCLDYDAADPILQFRTYVGQDAEKHGVCDDAPGWLEAPRAGSPVEVLAEIVRAYHEGQDWPVVKAILEEKVFRLVGSVRPAQPGRCFDWRLEESQQTDMRNVPIAALDPSCRREDAR
jgi:hypothetical protein